MTLQFHTLVVLSRHLIRMLIIHIIASSLRTSKLPSIDLLIWTRLCDREFLPGYEPVLKSFSISKARPTFPSAWLKSLEPLTFNGPFIEWTFPLNLVRFICPTSHSLCHFPGTKLGFIHAPTNPHPVGVGNRASCLHLNIPFLTRPYTCNEPSRWAQDLSAFLPPSIRPLCRLSRQRTSPRLQLWNPTPTPHIPRHNYQEHRNNQYLRRCNTLIHLNCQTCGNTVFRPSVRNSHAMIICLDPRFEDHLRGCFATLGWGLY